MEAQDEIDLDEVCNADTADEFADYIMDELGRWAASDCPILFKSRRLQTKMFSALEVSGKSYAPVQLKFTKNGFVIIKVSKSDSYNDILVTRFPMADPSLRDNILSCINNLKNEDYGDFIGVKEAQSEWRR